MPMTNTPTILVSPDAPTLIQDTAQLILALSREAIAAHGVFHVALSGGHTPNALFHLLAGDEFAGQFDWARVHLWWSDERHVPVDSPECNFNMAYEALISNIDIPEDNVHRVRIEMHAEAAALQYEREVLRYTGEVFDLILLGLGEDGHTASCFPGTVQHIPPDRLVVAHYVPQVNMWRITFTPRLINAAHHVLFLVSGSSKAAILQHVLHGPHQPEVLPAQLVAPTAGDLTWMVDRDAANGHF